MSARNNSEETEQCFVQQEHDETQNKFLSSPLNLDILINVHKNLPGNELRSIKRPDKMIARTFVENKHFNILPSIVDSSCIEQQVESKTGVNRIKIGNKDKLSIQQFFQRKEFRLIYTNIEDFHTEKRTFTGKIRTINSVSDYNYKLFREIQEEIYISTQRQIDMIDSNFESGNLCRAYVSTKAQSREFFCMLQNDLNTYGYNIWFFFRLRNSGKGVATFHLLNLIKKTDNHKNGMKISVFSRKKHQKQKIGWVKGCDKISFGQTNFYRQSNSSEKYYYLSFQYELEYDDDEVYFAMNQPYTYTRMVNHISSLSERKHQKIQVEIRSIGHSLTDNVIPSVKIWSGSNTNKETILISARQHPCETVGSFVCEGMLNYLIGESQDVKALLEMYQFVVIPMVNPDGVIHGSSRCNLAGFDLNRQWSEYLIKDFTPETFKIKKYVHSLHKTNPIKYFFDLHGHGKKLNTFFFSCKKIDKPSNRLIQLVMNKIQPRFNILDCTYGIDRDKYSTARSQFFHGLGIQNCYTVENSLYGYLDDKGVIKHYTQSDLFEIGKSVLKGIFVLENKNIDMKKVIGFSKDQLLQNSAALIQKITEKQKTESKSAILQNASDSDPDGDILDVNQRIQTCCKNNDKLKRKITENIKIIKEKNKDFKRVKKASKASNCTELDYYQMSTSQNNNSEPLSEQKKVISKLSISNRRKTVYSRKIKEKQIPNFKSTNFTKEKRIEKKKVRDNLNKSESQGGHVKQVSDKLRNSSSLMYEYPHDFLYRNKKSTRRIKTEQNLSESVVPGIVYDGQQISKEDRYTTLKEESLKALLTDTFSILKVKPKLSIKKYIKSNPNEKQRRSSVLSKPSLTNDRTAKDLNITSQKRAKTFSCTDSDGIGLYERAIKKAPNQARLYREQTGRSLLNNKSFKYKRFQSFMMSGINSSNSQKQSNSVFYYFPVL